MVDTHEAHLTKINFTSFDQGKWPSQLIFPGILWRWKGVYMADEHKWPDLTTLDLLSAARQRRTLRTLSADPSVYIPPTRSYTTLTPWPTQRSEMKRAKQLCPPHSPLCPTVSQRPTRSSVVLHIPSGRSRVAAVRGLLTWNSTISVSVQQFAALFCWTLVSELSGTKTEAVTASVCSLPGTCAPAARWPRALRPITSNPCRATWGGRWGPITAPDSHSLPRIFSCTSAQEAIHPTPIYPYPVGGWALVSWWSSVCPSVRLPVVTTCPYLSSQSPYESLTLRRFTCSREGKGLRSTLHAPVFKPSLGTLETTSGRLDCNEISTGCGRSTWQDCSSLSRSPSSPLLQFTKSDTALIKTSIMFCECCLQSVMLFTRGVQCVQHHVHPESVNSGFENNRDVGWCRAVRMSDTLELKESLNL